MNRRLFIATAALVVAFAIPSVSAAAPAASPFAGIWIRAT